jgi:predicted dehydrogenase/threonine dehydrogenase-like Zn-dependent dehydrogenase
MQNFKTGELEVAEVPRPGIRPGGVIVANAASLISAGTEKAAIELARMNPLQKAKARPDLVRKVLNRSRQEGLLSTAQTVMNLVSAPLPLGYSCAGVVREVGDQVTEFKSGDRVACAGYGYANHAEVVFAPRNLTVLVPDAVAFDEAAFVTVGAIAMHGVRQSDVAVGESVVVLGLGLLGQLTAQLCRAAGCRVFGVDPDSTKIELANRLDALDAHAAHGLDVTEAVEQFTHGRGADSVIITAATKSNQPIEQAIALARDRARIVIVGDVPIDIPRRPFYDKELELRISRSYGPGRYDPRYEERGQDYPIGYVRWTENRNMEGFLDLIAARKVQVRPLISHRFAIDEAQGAYALLDGKDDPYIGILIEYEPEREQPSTVQLRPPASAGPGRGPATNSVRFGVIGAGQYAQGILLPRLRKIDGVRIEGVATGNGYTARAAAEKLGCSFCTSDYNELLARPEIDAVIIATPHHLHARMTVAALEAGKHVFLEKPVAIDPEGLTDVVRAYDTAGDRIVVVGFSRRHSPAGLAAREMVARAGAPAVIDYRINAGALPADHWVHDPAVGGGRIVGEMCHSVDLARFIVGHPVAEVAAWSGGTPLAGVADPDTVAATLAFDDGSVATIRYLANGEPSIPKERVEIFCAGNVLTIDNYRAFKQVGPLGKRSERSWLSASKGRKSQLEDFVRGVRGDGLTFDFGLAVATTETTFRIREAVRGDSPIPQRGREAGS